MSKISEKLKECPKYFWAVSSIGSLLILISAFVFVCPWYLAIVAWFISEMIFDCLLVGYCMKFNKNENKDCK